MHAPVRPGWVDAARLARVARNGDHWFTAGRDAGGTHYSPLAGINSENAAQLGFAWQYELGMRKGLEATPIVVDGATAVHRDGATDRAR